MSKKHVKIIYTNKQNETIEGEIHKEKCEAYGHTGEQFLCVEGFGSGTHSKHDCISSKKIYEKLENYSKATSEGLKSIIESNSQFNFLIQEQLTSKIDDIEAELLEISKKRITKATNKLRDEILNTYILPTLEDDKVRSVFDILNQDKPDDFKGIFQQIQSCQGLVSVNNVETILNSKNKSAKPFQFLKKHEILIKTSEKLHNDLSAKHAFNFVHHSLQLQFKPVDGLIEVIGDLENKNLENCIIKIRFPRTKETYISSFKNSSEKMKLCDIDYDKGIEALESCKNKSGEPSFVRIHVYELRLDGKKQKKDIINELIADLQNNDEE